MEAGAYLTTHESRIFGVTPLKEDNSEIKNFKIFRLYQTDSPHSVNDPSESKSGLIFEAYPFSVISTIFVKNLNKI